MKPNLDQGPDYERGFVDGMLYQTQTSVDKAVNAMAQPEQRPWVSLTDEPTYTEQQIANACWAAEISDSKCESLLIALQESVEAASKEKNT